MTLLERAEQLVTKELDGEARGKLYAILAKEFPDQKDQIGTAMWKANRKFETNKPMTDEQIAAVNHYFPPSEE